jgi:hypothetical protein
MLRATIQAGLTFGPCPMYRGNVVGSCHTAIMPKLRHEAVVEILQNEPKLVLWLLTHSGAPLRLGARLTATIADSNLTDRDPDEDDQQIRGLFSDNVFVFEDDGRRIAVVAEVQTDHPDKERALSWPAYIANARRQHRCDTLLMIFAITKDAARGSAKPIRTGHPGWDLVPLISGIGKIPGLPEDGARFGAELVLLRIITCELTLDTHDARMFALAAIRSAPAERITRYTRYLKALVPPSTRKDLETLMKTVLKDAFIDGWIEEGLAKGMEKGLEQGREQGLGQGREQGRVEMLLELLETRFSVSDEIRKQVEECTAETQVKTWFKRAISASSLEEVFAELRTHISSSCSCAGRVR